MTTHFRLLAKDGRPVVDDVLVSVTSVFVSCIVDDSLTAPCVSFFCSSFASSIDLLKAVFPPKEGNQNIACTNTTNPIVTTGINHSSNDLRGDGSSIVGLVWQRCYAMLVLLACLLLICGLWLVLGHPFVLLSSLTSKQVDLLTEDRTYLIIIVVILIVVSDLKKALGSSWVKRTDVSQVATLAQIIIINCVTHNKRKVG